MPGRKFARIAMAVVAVIVILGLLLGSLAMPSVY
jgi:hypothetical protein